MQTPDVSTELDKDEEGRSLLHWAVDGGHASLVECLLGRGAKADVKDSEGDTPLDYAELCEYTELAERLVGGSVTSLPCVGGELTHTRLDTITHIAAGHAGAAGAATEGRKGALTVVFYTRKGTGTTALLFFCFAFLSGRVALKMDGPRRSKIVARTGVKPYYHY